MSAWDRDADHDAWEDEQDSIGAEMAMRQELPQPGECPAGGPHVLTYDSSHPDRMFDREPHCDECGISLPRPEGPSHERRD